jgi:hypothetical protein
MDEFIENYKGSQIKKVKKWYKNKKFEMSFYDIYPTSIHEAGHAVVNILMGKRIEKVSAIPSTLRGEENIMGYVDLYERDMEMFDCIFWDDVGMVNNGFHDKTLSALSGCMATSKIYQNLFMYEAVFGGGQGDLKSINHISKRRMEYSIKECETLLDNEYVWNTIVKLASLLRMKKHLSGVVVKRLVNDNIPQEVFNKLVEEYRYVPDWAMTWIDEYTFENCWYGCGEDIMDSHAMWGERDLPAGCYEYYYEE